MLKMVAKAWSTAAGSAGRLACGLALLALLTACNDQKPPSAAAAPPPAPPVTVAKPVVKEIVETDEFTGRFDATAAVDVRARVGGYLESIHFKDGSIVKQGDLLYVIDRRPFQAAFTQAEAAVQSIQTRLELSKVELERATNLSRTGAGTIATLDQRQQNFLQAQADIIGNRAALEMARLNLEFTEIKAPISGRISRTRVTEGNLVEANGSVLTSIVSLDPIYFYFDVDERTYLAYTRAAKDGSRPSGREVRYPVTVALSDEKTPSHKGTMDFVDNRVDQATGTMRGRALIENDRLVLVPGLFGRIQIPGSGQYKAVLIPDEAIAADQDRRFVWVVGDDGTVTAQVIKPGPKIDGYRVARTGLTGTETIIVKGIQRARPGGKVTPQVTELTPTR